MDEEELGSAEHAHLLWRVEGQAASKTRQVPISAYMPLLQYNGEAFSTNESK